MISPDAARTPGGWRLKAPLIFGVVTGLSVAVGLAVTTLVRPPTEPPGLVLEPESVDLTDRQYRAGETIAQTSG